MKQVIFDPLSLVGTWSDSEQVYYDDAFSGLISLISTEALKIDSQEVVVSPTVLTILEASTCGQYESVAWRHAVDYGYVGYIGEIQVLINIYWDDSKPIVIVSGDPDLENTAIVLKNVCFQGF